MIAAPNKENEAQKSVDRPDESMQVDKQSIPVAELAAPDKASGD